MSRYDTMKYRRCGKSGVLLPGISLGLWYNFGTDAPFTNCKEMILGSFDLGITHFDIANNYGPLPGSAEETFGKILKKDLMRYRDELFISTKAGYDMWAGPYGEWGSKKHLISSLDQSLKRTGLEYVDLFYHHRPDPDTPIEETIDALEQIMRSGKAIYAGISNYDTKQSKDMIEACSKRGIRLLINQINYSMFQRSAETVIDALESYGVGSIAYCPLAQGLLTNKYLSGIPGDSRAATEGTYLDKDSVTGEVIVKVEALNKIAQTRGQSLAQMALCWVLQRSTSALIGASRFSQIEENVKALDSIEFTNDELAAIDRILEGK